MNVPTWESPISLQGFLSTVSSILCWSEFSGVELSETRREFLALNKLDISVLSEMSSSWM